MLAGGSPPPPNPFDDPGVPAKNNGESESAFGLRLHNYMLSKQRAAGTAVIVLSTHGSATTAIPSHAYLFETYCETCGRFYLWNVHGNRISLTASQLLADFDYFTYIDEE